MEVVTLGLRCRYCESTWENHVPVLFGVDRTVWICPTAIFAPQNQIIGQENVTSSPPAQPVPQFPSPQRVENVTSPDVTSRVNLVPPPPENVTSDTYVLDINTAGGRVIVCALCGFVSANQGDIANRYCGRCHLFHGAVAEGRRLHAQGGTHDCREWRTGHNACALCGRNLAGGSKA